MTNLKALGASKEEIDKATETIYGRVTHNHLERIAATLRNANPSKNDDPKFFNKLTSHDDWDQRTFEKFFADNHLKEDEETKECLLDLDYFRSTHKLRREDHWQS